MKSVVRVTLSYATGKYLMCIVHITRSIDPLRTDNNGGCRYGVFFVLFKRRGTGREGEDGIPNNNKQYIFFFFLAFLTNCCNYTINVEKSKVKPHRYKKEKKVCFF